MRDHDLELIAALVEGRLDDEAEARALIASSAEHAEEYEAQKLAYDALSSLGTASMSETESAALRRDLWTSLRATPAAKSANPWWYRWTAVAAGLLVVGGSVAVLNQNMGGGDDAVQTFAEVGESLDSDAGTGPSTTAAAGVEAPTAAGDDASGGGEESEGGDGESVTTIAAADGDDLSAEPTAVFSARASDIRDGAGSMSDMHLYGEGDTVDPAIEVCVGTATEKAGLKGFTVVATMDDTAPDPETASDNSTTTTTSAEHPAIAVASPSAADPANATLAFVDLDTCEVVYLDD